MVLVATGKAPMKGIKTTQPPCFFFRIALAVEDLPEISHDFKQIVDIGHHTPFKFGIGRYPSYVMPRTFCTAYHCGRKGARSP